LADRRALPKCRFLRHLGIAVLAAPAEALDERAAGRSSIAVSVGPGATALMRTPKAAASSAADLERPSSACLLAV